ncbi:MAG TPA: hypothetical protein VHA13_02715, partial [Gammaproteobacteria bacterium]|nr:hypothetical protein [Gammaproteobacteria bacterium]
MFAHNQTTLQPNFYQEREKENNKNRPWKRIALLFNTCAEISNVGILIQIIAKWIPSFAVLAQSAGFVWLMAIADPMIYFFRSLIRLTRLIGRNFFGIAFEEERDESPRFQKIRTIADLISMSLFVVAILCFAGILIAPPVNLTIAWSVALTGLLPIGFFDYFYPARKITKQYNRYKNDIHIKAETKDRLEAKYIHAQNAKKLYMALLVGLGLLLICGTAAAFAPPLLVPILIITSKIASLFLGGIAIGRFANFLFHRRTYLIELREM